MDPKVRKPVTKKSVCHWVWLRFAGKSAFGQLRGRTRAAGLSISARPDLKYSDWTHSGAAVELGCCGAANLQLRRWGPNYPTVSAGAAARRAGASSAARPALPQTPRPIRPFLPDPLPLGRAEAHGVARRSSSRAAGKWTRGRKTRTATVSAGRLQGNQLREPTSPEKLCSKLGESTEWPGLFNRRFLSWGGSPAGSRCPGAPKTRPLPPDCPFRSLGILSSLGGPAHREYLSWSPLPASPWWRPLHFHPGIAESGAPRHQERLLWRMDPRRTWSQRKRTEAGRARAEPGGTRPLSWGGRWPPKWCGSPR